MACFDWAHGYWRTFKAVVPIRVDPGLATREGGTHFDHDIPENAGTGGIVELLFSVN